MTTKLPKEKKERSEKSSLMATDIVGIVFRTTKLLVDFGVVLLFLFGLFGVGLGLGYVASLFDKVSMPDSTELVKEVTEVSRISKVVYADGSLISEVNSDLLRSPIASDAISDTIKQAVIATEDATFESHNGVVPKAVLRAALGSVGIGSSTGGSTLTQQLIKQQIVGDAPTFNRKANEIISALALERAMTKEEILTTYLNVSPFGRNNQGRNIAGVEEAAQGIFGKSAKDLTVPQAAFIAGLPQSPIVYSPYTAAGTFKSEEDMVYGIAREKDVLYNMYRAGYLNKESYGTYLDYDIKKDFKQPDPVTEDNKDYLYYTVMSEAETAMYEYLIKRDKVSVNDLKNDATVSAYEELARQELSQGGYTVTSTVDKTIYRTMQDVVATYGYILDNGGGGGTVETGSVLLDNQTGAILGFIAGRDYASNQNNHAFMTKRSPGSTVKPFLAYGVAIDQGMMGSASILSNYPTTFSDGSQIMHGTSTGTGMMTLQDALNASANIPAYWTYKMMRNAGVDVKSYMDKMHYAIDLYDIESLPLGGGIETTVVANTNAYQTLANGGVCNEHYIIDKITAYDGTVVYQHEAKPVQVYSKATASIIDMLLRGPLSSGITTTFAGRIAGINPAAASSDFIGKTGTSNDYVDIWLMLATPQISLGTWAGHDDNTSMDSLSSYNNNAEYVAYLTSALYQVDPSLFAGRFELDNSVIASNVLAITGERPGTVQVNGVPITLGGATTTSYWAKNGAPVTNYKFMIGGTDSDYAKAWSTLLPATPRQTPSSSTSTSSTPSSSSQITPESSSKE